jgi:predicted XRE-type DNA-binding protein
MIPRTSFVHPITPRETSAPPVACILLRWLSLLSAISEPVIPNGATRLFPAHVFVRRVAQRGISLRLIRTAQIALSYDNACHYVSNMRHCHQWSSMKKSKAIVTRTAQQLAKALGLTPADGAEIELRSALNSKIIEAVQRKGLTHAQVASLARTSRTRITAIMNRNTRNISTDLLLRILYALGYTAKITFRTAA